MILLSEICWDNYKTIATNLFCVFSTTTKSIAGTKHPSSSSSAEASLSAWRPSSSSPSSRPASSTTRWNFCQKKLDHFRIYRRKRTSFRRPDVNFMHCFFCTKVKNAVILYLNFIFPQEYWRKSKAMCAMLVILDVVLKVRSQSLIFIKTTTYHFIMVASFFVIVEINF